MRYIYPALVSYSLLVQDDLVALLRIPTLEEFAIAAFWDHYEEAKAGVVQGLRYIDPACLL